MMFKHELFKISWYMRGGVSSHDLFHTYTNDDYMILNDIISENLKNTGEYRMPLV